MRVAMKSGVAALLAIGAMASSLNANASLIGQNITADWLFPNNATVYATQTVTVGAGPEIVCAGGGVGTGLCTGFIVGASIDIGADSITLDVNSGNNSWTANAFNGYRFSDLSLGGTWTSDTLSTNMAGLDASRISFDGSALYVNMQGLPANAGDYFTITLNSGTVPEPSTVSLFGLSIAGLAFMRKRKAN